MGISGSLGRATERRRAEERQSIELSRSTGPTGRFQQVRRWRTDCPRRPVSPSLPFQHLGLGIFCIQSALWPRLVSLMLKLVCATGADNVQRRSTPYPDLYREQGGYCDTLSSLFPILTFAGSSISTSAHTMCHTPVIFRIL